MPLISCPDCGRQVSDRAVSCPGCGFPIAAEFGSTAASSASAAPAKDPQLEKADREIILAHLADLRALELSKYSIQQKLTKYVNRYDLGQVESLSQLREALINRVFDILMAVGRLDPYHSLTQLQLINRLKEKGLSLPFFNVEENGKREPLMYYLIRNEKVPDKVSQLISDEVAKNFPTLDTDRIRVKMALTEAYKPNLIPAPYRDVYPIYYLYDYLSTSRESLSDALLHVNLDLIRQRLDAVISAQCVTILQQAVTNAQLASIQSKFDTLIETARSIEKNTAAAARYAEISAAHLETIKYLQFIRI